MLNIIALVLLAASGVYAYAQGLVLSDVPLPLMLFALATACVLFGLSKI